jgi:hypothetical protein
MNEAEFDALINGHIERTAAGAGEVQQTCSLTPC